MAMAMSCAPACETASELVARGRESAAVLQALLLGQQPAVAAAHGLRELTDQILRCCDSALAALRDDAAGGGTRKRKPERGYGPAAAPPITTNSKRMRIKGGEAATRVEKRSKMEDGFIWRKYGQKEIHGSKYPRLYFRCTYKDEHGCTARRQVQRSESDPSVFLITYFGDHTCCRDDADADERPAAFVINFGSSTSDRQPQQSGSPWSSCGDDGLVVCKTPDLCNSPEDELRSGGKANESDEFIDEQSTSLPELMSMMSSSMEWDPQLDGCLDWPFCEGESLLFDDIGEFMGDDFDYFGLL